MIDWVTFRKRMALGANVHTCLCVLLSSLGNARKDIQAIGRLTASRRLDASSADIKGKTIVFVGTSNSRNVDDEPYRTLYDRNMCFRAALRASALHRDRPKAHDDDHDAVLPDCRRLGAPPCDCCRRTQASSTTTSTKSSSNGIDVVVTQREPVRAWPSLDVELRKHETFLSELIRNVVNNKSVCCTTCRSFDHKQVTTYCLSNIILNFDLLFEKKAIDKPKQVRVTKRDERDREE